MTIVEPDRQIAPMRMQQITRPMAHLIAARDFIAGVVALKMSSHTAHRAVALLAGQAVESLLEGYILTKLSPAEQPHDYHHDLENLWREAVARGLGVPAVAPSWLQLLAQGHRAPFAVRYQAVRGKSAKGFAHMSSYAPIDDLVIEIPKLTLLVGPHIEKFQVDSG